MPHTLTSTLTPLMDRVPSSLRRGSKKARTERTQSARRSHRSRTHYPLSRLPLRYEVASLEHWLDLNA